MGRILALLLALLVVSCTGTTGYDLVSFYAAARGPSDAVKGQPYRFEVAGTPVTLTRATLHVGAMYLTQTVPTSGGGPAPCTLPGTNDGAFVGEVRGGADIDLLDPALQQIPVTGRGSTIPATGGQVWLMYSDVNAPGDSSAIAPILTLEGSVTLGGTVQTFSALIWLDGSWQPNPPPSALPGEDPICEIRIVSGLPASFTLAQGGTLVLALDPKALFVNANFAQLPKTGCDARLPADLCFTNDTSNQPSTNLFTNLTSADAMYRFEWQPTAP